MTCRPNRRSPGTYLTLTGAVISVAFLRECTGGHSQPIGIIMPQHEHDPYAPITEEHVRQVRLDRLRFAGDLPIGPGVIDSMRLELIPDHLMRHIVLRVSGELLAEQLPPVTLNNQQQFTVPRFATWWDMWKAAHWERWYVWCLRELGWIRPARYVDEPHTHTTTVDVRGRWTYPRATTVAPGNSFGHVVYKSDSSFRNAGVRHW